MQFARLNFDKLLLSVLLLMGLFMLLHLVHHQGDQTAINWMENVDGQILAALLTLMVGARNAVRQSDGNGPPNGKT